jgi:hypothetical protein
MQQAAWSKEREAAVAVAGPRQVKLVLLLGPFSLWSERGW